MPDTPIHGHPVDVYRNLNNQCLSVRSRDTDTYGRVIDHVDRITISDASFVVQEAGRQRVLENEQKNVHAFVRGEWDTVRTTRPAGTSATRITYDPYEYESFVTCDAEQAVTAARRVFATPTDVVAVGIERQ